MTEKAIKNLKIGAIFIAVVFLFSVIYLQQAQRMQQKAAVNHPIEMQNAELTEAQKNILYEDGTETPFTSPLLHEERKGTFVTADTSLPVFRSDDKFDSGTGWPSFTRPIEGNIVLKTDTSLGVTRTEVISKDTGAHLGHVFDDGPEPTRKRFCINGLALKFIPDKQ